MDSLSEKVIYHQIVSTEKYEYYQLALNRFRGKNYVIQSVTCDGWRELIKDLLNAPTQMCHFHLMVMMRKLRDFLINIRFKRLLCEFEILLATILSITPLSITLTN